MKRQRDLMNSTTKIIFSIMLALIIGRSPIFGQDFVHPGILNNKSELEFIKDKVKKGEQPWKQAYDGLIASKYASLTYNANPSSSMDCGSYNKDKYGNTVPQCKTFVEDGMAAYTQALIWFISEDKRYANKSIQIMNAWASTYNKNEGSNARLNVSWAAPWYCNAGEIIRHCNAGGAAGWSSSDISKFEGMLAKFLPYVKDETMPGNNWIQSAIEAHFAMAVFTSNRAEFNNAVSRWKVRVKTYIYQTTDGPIPASFKSAPINGICMETARDLGHTKLGVNSMIYAAQTAHEQGVDLFSLEQKRIGDFLELHGSWMTGSVAVPSNVNGGIVKAGQSDANGIKPPSGGGGAAFEIAYNHLNKRLNRSLPYTSQMISKHRPAGIGQWVFKPETLTHGNLPFNLTNPSVAVTSVSITPNSLTLVSGQTSQLSNTILPTNATNKAVTYSSSNTSVATVNASGFVTAITPGSASITVKTNDGNKTASTIITVSPVIINQAPVVSFASPSSTTSYTAPAKVQAIVNASDADGSIASVDLYINNTFVRQEKAAPYEWNYTVNDLLISNLAAGTYTLKAIATDNIGKTAESSVVITISPVIVTNPCVGNSLPIISITSPMTNASFNEGTPVTLTANASDNGSIAQVEFFNGNISLGTDNTSPYSISLSSLAAGSLTITAIAKDNCNATKTAAPVTFTIKKVVVNTEPILGVTCASKNATLSFELGAAYRANATNYSWWFSGAQATITPQEGTAYKTSVVLTNNYTGGSVCVGVNLSVAPYYVNYCKVIGVCGARVGSNDLSEEENLSTEIATLFPNPASSDFLFIESNELVKKIEIKDEIGVTVKIINSSVSSSGIPIADLSAGTYTVRISLENNNVIKKLVIIR